MFVFAVRKSNPDLMAWLNCLAKRFGNRTLGQVIAENSLTGIKPIVRIISIKVIRDTKK